MQFFLVTPKYMKKSEVPKIPEYNVFVTYEESRSGGEPDSDEKWCSYSDVHVDYRITGAFKNKTSSSWYQESFYLENLNLVDVYIVLVRYSSGDTFGRSFGNGHIVGVYGTQDEAQLIVDQIEANTYTGQNGYVPWKGYFERFEYVDLIVTRLKDNLDFEHKSPKHPYRV